MVEDNFGQNNQGTSPLNQPSQHTPPLQVPPPPMAPMSPIGQNEDFWQKHKFSLLALFAVVVIGGAGLLGFILSRIPQKTIQTTTPGTIQDSGANDGISPAGESTTESPPDDAGASDNSTDSSVNSPDNSATNAPPAISVPEIPTVEVSQPASIQPPVLQQPPVVNVPIQNLLSAGTVTAVLEQTSPKKQITIASNIMEAAKFKLTASNETFKISEITLSLVDASVPKSITAVAINYDGQLVYKELLGNENVSKELLKISGLNLLLPKDTPKILSVSYQLADISNEVMSGKDVKTALYSLKGLDSQNRSLSYEKVVAGNSIYVYKTIPAISSVALSDSALVKGRKTIGKFSIANEGDGSFKWKKASIIFKCKFGDFYCGLSSGNPISKTDGLYNLEVIGPGVALGEERQDLLVDYVYFSRVAMINGVPKTMRIDGDWVFAHNTDGTVVGTFTATQEQEVKNLENYAITANVISEPVVGDFVSTKFSNSSAVIVSSAGTGPSQMNSPASFVWSDLSAVNHSLSSGDWHNDYLVRYLPLETQTLKK